MSSIFDFIENLVFKKLNENYKQMIEKKIITIKLNYFYYFKL